VLGIAASGGAIIAGLSVLVAIAVAALVVVGLANAIAADDRPRTDGRPTSRTQLGPSLR
jgi:hypothetical protein